MAERLIWLVPVGVAVLGVWRPRAGLLLLIGALPLFGSPPGGPYLAALEVAGLAGILTAWRGGRPRPSPLAWAAGAFVAVGLLSLVPTPFQPPSWRPTALLALLEALPGVETWPALYTWRAAADLILGWGLFLAVRRAFAGRSLQPVALALLVGLAATLLFGLASWYGLVDLGAYRPLYGIGSGRRLQSLFFLSGWLSEYIIMATPVALAALVESKGRARRLIAPLLALALACLVLTQQRGAWVAAAAQLTLWAAVQLPRVDWRTGRLRTALRAAAVSLLLAAVLLAGTAAEPLLQRARSMRSGFTARMPLWSSAVEMARQRPLLGWGLGSYTPAFDLLHPRGSSEARRFRGTAHSLYLHVAAERGALGLAALGLLGWAVAVCLRRPRKGQERLALGLGISLWGFAVYGLVQYMFHLRNLAWLFWILIACVSLVGGLEGPARVGRLARILLLGAVLLLPVRLLLNRPPAYAGNHGFGLHEEEALADGHYRWTEGVAVQRLPWAGETLVVELANGYPLGGERPVTVDVGVDGRSVARWTISGGWQEHRIPLGPAAKESILLSLEARPVFRPFSDYRRQDGLARSTDIRLLGVAMKEPRWEGAPPAAGEH